jgi:hypothetical protein
MPDNIARAAAERIESLWNDPTRMGLDVEADDMEPIIEAAIAESAKERDAEVERLRGLALKGAAALAQCSNLMDVGPEAAKTMCQRAIDLRDELAALTPTPG